MRDHLGRLPIVVAARVGRLWSVYRPLDMVSYNQGESRERWVTELGLVAYYPLMLLAIAGAVEMLRRRRGQALWLLVVPAISATLVAAATYGQTRLARDRGTFDRDPRRDRRRVGRQHLDVSQVRRHGRRRQANADAAGVPVPRP